MPRPLPTRPGRAVTQEARGRRVQSLPALLPLLFFAVDAGDVFPTDVTPMEIDFNVLRPRCRCSPVGGVAKLPVGPEKRRSPRGHLIARIAFPRPRVRKPEHVSGGGGGGSSVSRTR